MDDGSGEARGRGGERGESEEGGRCEWVRVLEADGWGKEGLNVSYYVIFYVLPSVG